MKARVAVEVVRTVGILEPIPVKTKGKLYDANETESARRNCNCLNVWRFGRRSTWKQGFCSKKLAARLNSQARGEFL